MVRDRSYEKATSPANRAGTKRYAVSFLVIAAATCAECTPSIAMSLTQGRCIAAALDRDDNIDTVEKARQACQGASSELQALCADVALGKKHGTIRAIRDALTACLAAKSEGQVLCAKAALAHDDNVNSLTEALNQCN